MLKPVWAACCYFCCITVFAQPALNTKIDLNPVAAFQKIGMGTCQVNQGVLETRGAYGLIGDSTWTNYSFEFDAKAPQSADKVYLWAGFRTHNRDDRYVLALKGGFQNDLYLSRLGYMGGDAFLALRHLDFKLEKEVFYHIKVQVEGERIRVFLNNESLPRIDIIDKESAMAPSGGIALGGGWQPAVYKNLQVKRLNLNLNQDLGSNVKPDGSVNASATRTDPAKNKQKTALGIEYQSPEKDKEAERVIQRLGYHPITVTYPASGQVATIMQGSEKADKIAKQANRQEISLNGNWLFAPGYMIKDEKKAISPDADKYDQNWHIMPVPSFWNPDRIWLFGEKYGTASKGVSDSYYQKEMDRCEDYTFDYKKTNTGWYRQWVDLPASIEGKHLELNFDAVSKTCEIFINGQRAGSHIGMFGDIKIDATPFLKPGRNLIAVKVLKKYIQDIKDGDKIINIAASVEVTQKMLKDLPHGFFGDDPAGIWQPVSLIITDPLHIKNVYIRPDSTHALMEVTVENSSSVLQCFNLSTVITPVKNAGKGTEKAIEPLYKGTDLRGLQLNPGSTKTYTYRIGGLHPDLWSPEAPNLYDFDFSLEGGLGKIKDQTTVRSGFKSFVIKDGYFYLNGHPYWLRGGNQTAMPLAPNDTALAQKLSRMMHEGHMDITRTHTTPYTKTWMDASDKYGIGVSFEGTWPWLMLGDTPIPDQGLLDLWKKELLDLVRKYRNHPSLLIWTMNNEMKFYLNDPDKERAKQKMRIISQVVRDIRKEDPAHPVVFDSNYDQKQTEKRMGKAFMDSIDDGDIDDIHQYTNWYDESIFDEFSGRFEKRYKTAGRPLISQEMSTGYPDETGHPTRFYTFVHQNPSSLVGKYGYAYQDPRWFMQAQSFITKELAEALRRSNPHASGILHFSLATWFSQVDDVNQITPNKTYYAMQKALQPVLVTAELWGRHFYAGELLPTKVCIVNDQQNGQPLKNLTLFWALTGQKGQRFASGSLPVPEVPYYGRSWVQPEIQIPEVLGSERVDGKLVLELKAGEKLISANEYDLSFATNKWAGLKGAKNENVRILDLDGKIDPALKRLRLHYTKVTSFSSLISSGEGVAILAASDTARLSPEDLERIAAYTKNGGRLLVIHGTGIAAALFPASIRGVITANKEIANLEIPESPVFKGLMPLDIRYFNNQKNQLPTVLENAYQINRNAGLQALSSCVKIHGYLSGQTPERMATLDKIKGFPIVLLQVPTTTSNANVHQGRVILTTLQLEKGDTDPIAGRLLTNMIEYLVQN